MSSSAPPVAGTTLERDQTRGAEPAGRASCRSGARVCFFLRGPWWFRGIAAPDGQDPGVADAAPPLEMSAWLPATVPGCVHTDLLANGKIGDPFYGENEKDQQWIDRCDWEYKTIASVDESTWESRRIELVCNGLDTFATVHVNEREVLTANNMFRRWRADVKPFLRPGANDLRIRFRSPIREVESAYRGLGYRLPAANDQGRPMVSMFARKAPYHYGWDWGPRLVTTGIWRPVTLEAWDIARIDDVHVAQDALSDERARLRIRVSVVACRNVRGSLRVVVEGTGVGCEVDADLCDGDSEHDACVTIERPQLWWPRGLGAPHLYRVSAVLSVDGYEVDARTVRVGLRSVEVMHRADGDGKSLAIHVNGAPAFMKGANYIPQDSFPSRPSDERYRDVLESAARSNMNMLRVWGGGVYEDDRFYDLCDELGILVWQDFMFACSMYPGDDEFVENVREEAIQNVRRLRNHPCLALWAGNNEIEVAWHRWGWQQKFDLSPETQKKIWRDYERIFHEVLPAVMAAHDPSRFYTRSSPSANDDRILPDTVGFGDMHYWGVWHGERPYSDYAENVSRFMSEYGFQSFPEIQTVARYAPRSEWRLDSSVMVAHQRHPRGNELIRTYMARDFREPKDFDSFLYVSQVLQATIVKYAAEAHRRRMPYCAGSLYWQLDDCWPVASWSGIDYFGRWKALHYFAVRFFAPVLVTVADDGRSIAVSVVSDRRDELRATLVGRLLDFEGTQLWHGESAVCVAPNQSQVHLTIDRASLLANAPANRSVLAMDLVDGPNRLGRSLHYFMRPKDLDLPDPELTVRPVASDNGNPRTLLRVEARKLAKSVRLSADDSEGRFSDNYFDLLPGEATTVEYSGLLHGAVSVTSIRDTY